MSDEKKKPRPPRSRKWWKKHVEACEQSGKTLSEYAKENDINVGNFYAWNGKLRGKSSKRVQSRATISKTEKTSQQETKDSKELSFVEVSVADQQTEKVTITCPSGWSVSFSTTLDPGKLSGFLDILEDRS